MRTMSHAPIRVLFVCLFSMVFAATDADAAITFGGQGSGLVLYDLEEFAPLAVGQGAAFVVLRNDAFGISFGEKLTGQTQANFNGFDTISGTPSAPLMIDETTDAAVGVNILPFGGAIIDGLGSVGFPSPAAIGDGALTALYDQDQFVVAFDVVGANGGEMTIQFFGRDGVLLDSLSVFGVVSDTYIFGSSGAGIAAITITNTDPSGLGFDNFIFASPNNSAAGSCNLSGPFAVSAFDPSPTVVLDAAAGAVPTGTNFSYTWVSDCPGASFTNSGGAQTALGIVPDGPCSASCTVSLVVDDGLGVSICSATVAIEGDSGGSGGPALSCPPDMTVESDGAGNLADLTAWLASVGGNDAIVNDFSGITASCGTSGSATVTWTDPSVTPGGCAVSQCSATFAILDTVGPDLVVSEPVIVIDHDSCDGFVEVELGDVFVDGRRVSTDGERNNDTDNDSDSDEDSDSSDSDERDDDLIDDADGGAFSDVVVTNDAPNVFPVGETTIVTFTATDACGNTTTATLTVVVPYNSGVDVAVLRRSSDDDHSHDEDRSAIPGVTVFVFDASRDACARPNSGRDFAAILQECAPVASGETGESGSVRIGLPPGRYVLVAPVDADGDGLTDELLGAPTGRVRCGHWKSRRLLFGDGDER